MKVGIKNKILNIIYKQPENRKRYVKNQDTLTNYGVPYNPITTPEAIIRINTVRERLKLLKPIETQEEYEKVFSEILEYQKPNTEGYKPFIDFEGYDDVDINLLGLVPYCGKDDKSEHINIWLTGRNKNRIPLLNDTEMAKIVRVLDFSLKNMDKKYGKYNGIVYRKGFFNPITYKQYYSSSYTIEGAITHSGNSLPSPNNSYSIIKLKNGHKMYDFQKDSNSDIAREFAESETEVLIDRKSKFRFVPEKEYTIQDKKMKENILVKSSLLSTDDVSKN